jgi:hypothetical protein
VFAEGGDLVGDGVVLGGEGGELGLRIEWPPRGY